MFKAIPGLTQSGFWTAGLLLAGSVCAQLPVPIVELSFSETNGLATTNSGSLGGSGVFVQRDALPVFSSSVPTGPYAPANILSSVDFGPILAGQGGRAVDFTTTAPGGTLGLLDAFTVAGWVNARDLSIGPGGNRITFAMTVGNGPGFDIVQLNTGALRIGINQWPDGANGGGPSSSTGKITADPNGGAANWVFFAVTFDKAVSTLNLKYYFGAPTTEVALDTQHTYQVGNSVNCGPLTIGNFSTIDSNARNATGSNSRVFRGLMDEIRVFSRALTLAEIRQVQRAAPFAPVDLPPVIAQIHPEPGGIVRELGQVEVIFNESVQGVDASDLLINGQAAATNLLAVAPDEYVFSFPSPATGVVSIAWAASHGIADRGDPPNGFSGEPWSYTLDPNAPRAHPIISEFMADNDNTLNDEDGNSSDWIEIYNPDVEPLHLAGFFLSDSTNWLAKWRFPAVVMPPNSYLVVFASEKNRTNLSAPLHTNFKLELNGEFLALSDPNTNVISHFAPFYPRQAEDVSYGRDRLSPDQVGYYDRPTPGAPNATSGAGFAPQVQFSLDSGHFTSPFQLTLSTPSTNAIIRYLLVNTAATAANTNVPGTNSPIYTEPLLITNTVQVRARAFVPGLLPGEPRSETFISFATSLLGRTSDLPIMVVHTLGGADFNTAAYNPAHLTIFEPLYGLTSFSNAPTVTTRAALRVRGFTSANSPKKSWTLELRDEFNDDKDVSLLGMPAESDWVLYGPGAIEPVLIHNAFAYELARRFGQWAPRTRFVELYLSAGNAGMQLATNHYHGIYLLMEKIKVAPGRIEAERLEPEHTKTPAVTGTYLLQMDRVEAGESGLPIPSIPTDTLPPPGSGHAVTYTEPKESEIKLPQRAAQEFYIRDYMTNFIRALNSPSFADPVNGYARYVDIPPSIDQHIVKLVCFSVDAYVASSFFYKPRNGKLVFGPVWDFDRSLESAGDPRDDNPRIFRYVGSWEPFDFFNDLWWGPMFRDTNFWQLYVDRYQQLRKTELSHPRLGALIDELARQVRGAVPRDTARWSSVYSARTSYEWEVFHMKDWLTNRLHFMDTNFVPMPILSTTGGRAEPGVQVSISVPPGAPVGTEVYYTLDGSDPRLPGGAISSKAVRYAGPITISANALLMARSYHPTYRNLTGGAANGNPPVTTGWSGPARAPFHITDIPLVVTELMFHPASAPAGDTNDADNFEFIELKNVGTNTLNLVGMHFTEGIQFTFDQNSAVTNLPPNARVVLVKNIAAFQSRYQSIPKVVGEYVGNFANEGERVVLLGALDEPILDFTYSDAWVRIADGFGFSLVPSVGTDPSNATNWNRSDLPGGSPGEADIMPAPIPPVYINEVLTHTDLPTVDAIELYNSGPASADLSGWFLTDEYRTPRKFVVPVGTVLPAGGYLTLYESNSFGRFFQLSSQGDELYLFSADGTNLTGYVDGFDFGAQFRDATFGRHRISTGADHLVPQSATTLGASNAGPRVGPVVIGEIMYRPADVVAGGVAYDDSLDEFIELHNITDQPVPLFAPAFPTNTWRLQDAVDFTFPTDTWIGPSGYILLVNFHPTNTPWAQAFRARYGVPEMVPLFGPYSGKLDNSSDRVELVRPDDPEMVPGVDFGTVPYVLAERVAYKDVTPWPVAADGFGYSLQRRNVQAYGNDPQNWVAALPTAAAAYPGGQTPIISEQPAAQTVVGHTAANFRVVAEGTGPFTYQWLFNGQMLPEATNSVLELTRVLISQAGSYQALVIGAGGVVSSQPATLNVITPVLIVQQPLDKAERPGANVTFNVMATSSRPFTFQWRFNGENITGATNSTLVLTNVQPAQDGFYTALVADSISTDISEPARLAVLVNPVVAQHPEHRIAAVGERVDITVIATNTATLPLTYRWRKGSGYLVTNGPAWSRQDTLTLSNVSLASASNYAVVLVNAASSGVLSSAGNLTVVAPPSNQVITAGGNATFEAIVAAPRLVPVQYEWLFNGTTIPNVTTHTLAISNADASKLGTYAVRVIAGTAPQSVDRIFAATLSFPMADSDNDGMPDDWESVHACLSGTTADAAADADGDSMSNLSEYLAGTNPCDRESYLKAELVRMAGLANVALRFNAVSNRTYSILYQDVLGGTNPWRVLQDVQVPNSQAVEIQDSHPASATRFYRLVTPRMQ